MNCQKPTEVLALTILDAHSMESLGESLSLDTNVLVVVRRKVINQQHAEIACVPTERIASDSFDSIVGCAEIYGRDDRGYYLRSSPASSLIHPAANVLTHAVKSIFNQKLGTGEDFEKGNIQFDVAPKLVRIGTSPVFSEDDIPEVHKMLNVAVYLTQGKKCIPSETTSYLHTAWHPIGEIIEKVENNQKLSFGHSNQTFPLGGLCLCAVEWLQNHFAHVIC